MFHDAVSFSGWELGHLKTVMCRCTLTAVAELENKVGQRQKEDSSGFIQSTLHQGQTLCPLEPRMFLTLAAHVSSGCLLEMKEARRLSLDPQLCAFSPRFPQTHLIQGVLFYLYLMHVMAWQWPETWIQSHALRELSLWIPVSNPKRSLLCLYTDVPLRDMGPGPQLGQICLRSTSCSWW